MTFIKVLCVLFSSAVISTELISYLAANIAKLVATCSKSINLPEKYTPLLSSILNKAFLTGLSI